MSSRFYLILLLTLKVASFYDPMASEEYPVLGLMKFTALTTL